MVLGRLTHYLLDAVLLSTLASGVRRTHGLSLDTARIEDATARGAVEKYLGVGDFVFDAAAGAAGASRFFVRNWAQSAPGGGQGAFGQGRGRGARARGHYER